jgi:hypothetical protein
MIEKTIKGHIEYPFSGKYFRAQLDQDFLINRNSIDDFMLKTISPLTVLYQRFRAIKSSFVPFSVFVLLWRKANSFILLNEYKTDRIYPCLIVHIKEDISQICLIGSNSFVFYQQTNTKA